MFFSYDGTLLGLNYTKKKKMKDTEIIFHFLHSIKYKLIFIRAFIGSRN